MDSAFTGIVPLWVNGQLQAASFGRLIKSLLMKADLCFCISRHGCLNLSCPRALGSI